MQDRLASSELLAQRALLGVRTPARIRGMNEKEWVHSLVDRLQSGLQERDDGSLVVVDGRRLAYTSEIYEYSNDEGSNTQSAAYETDLLVYQTLGASRWIPRVVVAQARLHHNPRCADIQLQGFDTQARSPLLALRHSHRRP